MTKRDKERLRKWVAALRSGEYEQCRDQLRDGNRFCCLGVACDVAIKKGWVSDDKWIGDTYVEDILWDEDMELPPPVIAAYGLDSSDPRLPGGKTLISLNDEDHLSFPEIADAIEKAYEL